MTCSLFWLRSRCWGGTPATNSEVHTPLWLCISAMPVFRSWRAEAPAGTEPQSGSILQALGMGSFLQVTGSECACATVLAAATDRAGNARKKLEVRVAVLA